MSKFIFEIFSEELPATLQKKILIDYRQFVDLRLKTESIKFVDSDLFVGITLNRLVLSLNNVNINEEQAKNIIVAVLKDFSKMFPRTMCYPQMQVRWIRPIRNLFACIDERVLSGDFFGISLTNGTYIDKFDFYVCNSCDDYDKLIKDALVELDYNSRFNFIKEQIYNENKSYKNTKLIEELAGMSEYCIAPMKSLLDKKFSILPFELIELVLRENQRYVVFNPDEHLNIYFLIFGDKITKDENKRQQIIEGHRKVVNARLEDAIYYWRLDDNIKANINELKNILSNRIFIENLSWGEYLHSQETLCDKIMNLSGKEQSNKDIYELIWKTKIDLATGVVSEFPELQGIIGSYYFNYDFNPYVIDEQKLQQKLDINILYFYLIDRISYIKTMFFYGKQPTGSGDKYKVKARMDDIIIILKIFEENADKLLNIIDNHQLIDLIKENVDIYKLFCKRYQKYIEDTFRDNKNVKKFADVCTKLLEDKRFKMFLNIDAKLNLLDDKQFIKTYKRIIGYTNGVNFEENEQILEKVSKILPSKNNNIYISVNDYLENNKIADSLITKQALKYIESKYFASKLELKFLSII